MFKGQYFRKSTIAWLSTIGLLVMVGSGCARVDQPATPTDTTVPPATDAPALSNTPSPTDTPVQTTTTTPSPTDTPKPTQTSSPDRSATAVFQSTQTAVALLPEIDRNLQMADMSTETGDMLWVQDESVPIDLGSFEEALYIPFEGDPEGSDFALYTEITWVSTSGLAGCGLIFRSEPDFGTGDQYILETIRLSGLPQWDIIYIADGVFEKNVTGELATRAIDQDQGATNRLLLITEGEKFTVFINDRRIGSYFDYTINQLDGLFAFLAYQESGDTTCTFDNTWVWSLQ